MNITEIQNQINFLQNHLDSLKQKEYDWDDAPLIVEINGERWLLGQEAAEEMNWDDAVEWCKSIGGELPTRNILLECYLNAEINPLFKKECYWSSTEFSAANAWLQSFSLGLQDYDFKTSTYYVLAVRRLAI